MAMEMINSVVPLPSYAYMGPGTRRSWPSQDRKWCRRCRPTCSWGFIVEFDDIAFDAFGSELADDPNAQGSDSNRAANDAVHVKTLEGEHLLNTEPREDFGFHENDAEEDANEEARKFLMIQRLSEDRGNKIQDVMRPPVKKPSTATKRAIENGSCP